MKVRKAGVPGLPVLLTVRRMANGKARGLGDLSQGVAACALAILVIAAAAPASAQIVCRENSLGAQICTGVPAPTKLSREPYTGRPGVGAVIPRVQQPGAPAIIGAGRTDAFGNTFLTESDLPPARPSLPGVAISRDCRRDALGNLVCN